MQEEFLKHIDPESMLKGRMAESLVEEMLKQSGNTVYRFGYEAIIQNLTQIKRLFNAHDEVGMHIRTIPDFIVIDKKGVPSFVEVKFRCNGEIYKEKDHHLLDKIKHFWDAKIIFVNNKHKPYFRVSKSPYIDNNGNLKCESIVNEKEWNIDLKEYMKFEDLIEKYVVPKIESK